VTTVQQLGRTGDHREREKARERFRDSCLLPLGKQHRSARGWRIDRRPQKEGNPWADTATNSAGEVFTRGCKNTSKTKPPACTNTRQRSTHRKLDRHASLPLRSARHKRDRHPSLSAALCPSEARPSSLTFR
jgi:hypothetical protein